MKQRGFIAVSIVLVIMVIVLAIGSTVTLLSINEAQSGLVLFQGEDNLQFVEGCAEDALLKIQSNSSYGGGTILRPEGTCSITVNAPNPNWDITVSSTQTNFQRKVRLTFTKSSSKITLTSWKEI